MEEENSCRLAAEKAPDREDVLLLVSLSALTQLNLKPASARTSLMITALSSAGIYWECKSIGCNQLLDAGCAAIDGFTFRLTCVASGSRFFTEWHRVCVQGRTSAGAQWICIKHWALQLICCFDCSSAWHISLLRKLFFCHFLNWHFT